MAILHLKKIPKKIETSDKFSLKKMLYLKKWESREVAERLYLFHICFDFKLYYFQDLEADPLSLIPYCCVSVVKKKNKYERGHALEPF